MQEHVEPLPDSAAEPYAGDMASTRSAAAAAVPTEASEERVQEIREIAYAYYEARGCADGYAMDDWLRAEVSVQQKADDSLQPASAG
jgi:hypothetical protein